MDMHAKVACLLNADSEMQLLLNAALTTAAILFQCVRTLCFAKI